MPFNPLSRPIYHAMSLKFRCSARLHSHSQQSQMLTIVELGLSSTVHGDINVLKCALPCWHSCKYQRCCISKAHIFAMENLKIVLVTTWPHMHLQRKRVWRHPTHDRLMILSVVHSTRFYPWYHISKRQKTWIRKNPSLSPRKRRLRIPHCSSLIFGAWA